MFDGAPRLFSISLWYCIPTVCGLGQVAVAIVGVGDGAAIGLVFLGNLPSFVVFISRRLVVEVDMLNQVADGRKHR